MTRLDTIERRGSLNLLFSRLTGHWQIILQDGDTVSEYYRFWLAVIDVRVVLQRNVFSFVYGTRTQTSMASPH